MSLTFTRLALHCLQPCLRLVWKRRDGMASDREELCPSYREDTGASTVWSLGHAWLRRGGRLSRRSRADGECKRQAGLGKVYEAFLFRVRKAAAEQPCLLASKSIRQHTKNEHELIYRRVMMQTLRHFGAFVAPRTQSFHRRYTSIVRLCALAECTHID